MSWPCRLIDRPGGISSAVGDMWYLDPESDGHRTVLLAPEHAARRPIVVVLPGPVHFAVYGPTWIGGEPGPAGWKVEGEPPLLSVSPSINIHGVYHGYLGGHGTPPGVISDDVEGRKFNEQGRRAF